LSQDTKEQKAITGKLVKQATRFVNLHCISTNGCRVAGKIDRKRRDALTSSRRVARACQSRLHGRLREGVDA
jgi:hypothetical protein